MSQTKSLQSFYGEGNNDPALSWDRSYIHNVKCRIQGKFQRQMPSKRPGFGGGIPFDKVFNNKLRAHEDAYLGRLKVFAEAELAKESKEALTEEQRAALANPPFGSYDRKGASCFSKGPPAKGKPGAEPAKKKRKVEAAPPVRWSSRIAKQKKK
jgi:hypothetical protein